MSMILEILALYLVQTVSFSSELYPADDHLVVSTAHYCICETSVWSSRIQNKINWTSFYALASFLGL